MLMLSAAMAAAPRTAWWEKREAKNRTAAANPPSKHVMLAAKIARTARFGPGVAADLSREAVNWLIPYRRPMDR
jgi:hypothetical protein